MTDRAAKAEEAEAKGVGAYKRKKNLKKSRSGAAFASMPIGGGGSIIVVSPAGIMKLKPVRKWLKKFDLS